MDEMPHNDGTHTELTNTNKLIRFYDGCDGLKTGSADISKYCLCATAQKEGMRLIAIVLGMAVGLTGIPVPQTIISIMDKSSACMGPVSMLLAGITISEFKFPALLKNKKNYIIVFLRLIVIPGLLGLLLMPLKNPVLLQSAVLLYAMPCEIGRAHV